MIHKFQNIHGITYVIPKNLTNIKEEFEKLILNIFENKKLPFTDIYVKMPVFVSQKFIELVWEKNIKIKESEIRHDTIMIKF
jgi:hypothetical protein